MTRAADDYRVLRIPGASGRVWIVDEREQAKAWSAGQTTPFYGWPEGHEEDRHWVQRALHTDDHVYEPEREHLRRAWRAAQFPEVAESPYVHAPVDFLEPYDLYLVQELAEADLEQTLRDEGPLDADALEDLGRRLRAGLAVFHGLGLVHSDVREGNVLRVRGQWVLGDLGGVVHCGDPTMSIQDDHAYRLGDAALGRPAAPENDLHALTVLLEHAARPRGS